MPGADFFARLGLYCERDFLDRAVCDRLCREAKAAPTHDSLVGRGGSLVVDESERKSKRAQLAPETSALVSSLLRQAMPKIAAHFALELQECQEPQLLRYASGDFFIPHRDSYKDAGELERVRVRVASVVIFLNRAADPPGEMEYSGGALTLYGLMKKPGSEEFGMPLDAEPGLLVAFPSETLHEVQPVAAGERFTLVSWYS